MVRWFLRLEGLAILLAALSIYYFIDGSWLIFVLFLFVPDVSMIGYLQDKKLGALLYNLMHNLVLSLLLQLIGFFIDNEIMVLAGIILLAHVGLDRFLGFGLKYQSNFKDSHLQRV